MSLISMIVKKVVLVLISVIVKMNVKVNLKNVKQDSLLLVVLKIKRVLVTVDKAEECLSLDDYQELSIDLLLVERLVFN